MDGAFLRCNSGAIVTVTVVQSAVRCSSPALALQQLRSKQLSFSLQLSSKTLKIYVCMDQENHITIFNLFVKFEIFTSYSFFIKKSLRSHV